jgi:hypothetical protein
MIVECICVFSSIVTSSHVIDVPSPTLCRGNGRPSPRAADLSLAWRRRRNGCFQCDGVRQRCCSCRGARRELAGLYSDTARPINVRLRYRWLLRQAARPEVPRRQSGSRQRALDAVGCVSGDRRQRKRAGAAQRKIMERDAQALHRRRRARTNRARRVVRAVGMPW